VENLIETYFRKRTKTYEVKSVFRDQEFTERNHKVGALVDRLERLPFAYNADLSVHEKLNDEIIRDFLERVSATLGKLTPSAELPVVVEACDGLVSLAIDSRNAYGTFDVLGIRHGYGFFGQLPIIRRIRQRIESSRKKFDRDEFRTFAKIVAVFSHDGSDSQRLLEACFGDQHLGRKGYHQNGVFRVNKNTRFSAVVLGISSVNIVRKVEYLIVAMNPYAEIDLPFF
jgi:hypothetical protein